MKRKWTAIDFYVFYYWDNISNFCFYLFKLCILWLHLLQHEIFTTIIFLIDVKGKLSGYKKVNDWNV